MSTRSLQYILRPYQPSDKSFIYSSILSSHFNNNKVCKLFQNWSDYRIHKIAWLDRLGDLEGATPGATVLLAVSERDPVRIYSYCLYEHLGEATVVHYIYTKQAFRHLGLAHTLLRGIGLNPHESILTTHWTDASIHLAKKARSLQNQGKQVPPQQVKIVLVDDFYTEYTNGRQYGHLPTWNPIRNPYPQPISKPVSNSDGLLALSGTPGNKGFSRTPASPIDDEKGE